MAIITQLPNTAQMAFTEYSCALQTQTISIPTEEPELDFCFCDFECDFTELVLADLSTTDDYKNDRTSILIDLPDSSLTFTISLVNTSTGAVTPLIDPTYGTYYAVGSISGHPTKGGYLIEWNKVATLLGFGTYYITQVQTLFTGTVTGQSYNYRLMPYTEITANRTVKIESVHNGCIQSGVDYTGMNWYKSIRIPGKFGNKVPRMEVDNYVSTNRKVLQIQDQIVNEYTLFTRRVPMAVLNPLVQDRILANSIFVTDYNLDNPEDIRQKEVVALEVIDTIYNGGSRKAKYNIKFEEKLQNIIKRN